jgi:predicted O-methyltransferase YrrM
MIKNVAGSIYRRSSMLQSIRRRSIQSKYSRLAQQEAQPFNGDIVLTQTVDSILDYHITQCLETGTYLGYTCRYLASKHPNIPILTIEYNELFFAASRSVLCQFPNVTQFQGDSGQVTLRLFQEGKIGELPFIFLDAHWGALPLPAELHNLSHYLANAVVLIHDFRVPGRDDFGYDIYEGHTIGIEMLSEGLGEVKGCKLYLPTYTYCDAFPDQLERPNRLRGHALVFLNATNSLSQFCESDLSRFYISHDF